METPSGLTVLEDGLHLVITRRWTGPMTVAGLLTALIWNGLMIAGVIAVHHYMHYPVWQILLVLFCTPLILFSGFGVFSVYITLLRLCNYTRLTAGSEGLQVWHGPLPSVHRSVAIPLAELKQIFCEGRGDGTCNVLAVLQNGKRVKLLSGLHSNIPAKFIEERVEERLGIVDSAVPGEIKAPTISPRGQAFLNNLVCPHCAHPISSAEINLRTGMATCGACGQAFSFAEGLQRAMAKPLVPSPPSVRVWHEGEDLVLDIRCFKAFHLIFVGILLLFGSLYGVFWKKQADPQVNIVAPIVLSVLAFFFYLILTQLLNHILVRVNRQTLSVHVWPLPLGRSRKFDARMIEQLYVQQSLQNSNRGGITYHYDLLAVLQDGQREFVLPTIYNLDASVVLFLEQEIERHLGITDAPVVGEMALGR